MKKGYKNIKVKLLNYQKDIAKIIWEAMRTVWTETLYKEYDPSDKIVIETIDNVLQGKSLPKNYVKFSQFQVVIDGLSTICLAQITRDDGWTWMAQSSMPRYLPLDPIVPIQIQEKFPELVNNLKIKVEELYKACIDEGIPPQDARYITLRGQTTALSGRCDMVSVQKACLTRLDPNTHDEINYVYRKMLNELKKTIETDIANGTLDKLSYKIWSKLINDTQQEAAKSGLYTKYDACFCNSFNVYNSFDDEPEPLYDYRKLSFKNELERIYDEESDLLTIEEKKMIERWRDGIE